MKHANVFTQMDKIETPEESHPPQQLFANNKLKIGWKSVCTLLCAIALTLECINVTLNAHCNNGGHHKRSSTYMILLQHLPRVIPVPNGTIPEVLQDHLL